MDDAGDDLCYAVDVCNRFSLLTIETTTAEESGVEEFPINLVCKPISKVTKSKGGLEKVVTFNDSNSSCSEDQLATVVESRKVETKEHIHSLHDQYIRT